MITMMMMMIIIILELTYIVHFGIYFSFYQMVVLFYTHCYIDIQYQNSTHLLEHDSVANLFTSNAITSQVRCHMTCHKQAV